MESKKEMTQKEIENLAQKIAQNILIPFSDEDYMDVDKTSYAIFSKEHDNNMTDLIYAFVLGCSAAFNKLTSNSCDLLETNYLMNKIIVQYLRNKVDINN